MELRNHYRRALRRRIDRYGFQTSKLHVFQALLRLRQAACHPGLVDQARVHHTSTKLDLLLERLGQARNEGHKALVFSQFTRLLAIVRKRLDEAGVSYEYLDGQTRDRETRVERFQSDRNRSVFLISLKAGGLGLNLTAADYVFLLDPWWNPAVEAQAIDRAHRIGQSRPVLACRLIARNTIEEKVVELQEAKRELVESILGSHTSPDFSREDLEFLIS
jgi:SNF2 family DNA or RNA helicase